MPARTISVDSNTPQGAAFAALGLAAPLVKAVVAEGYVTPTPIQTQAIPHVLAGKDLLGVAQTGTGKTAAFILPILQNIGARPRTGKIRVLVLAPTRELAAQIGERAGTYGKFASLRHTVIFGGVGQRAQEIELSRKPDILVATPGRLLDLMEQRFVDLSGVEIFVVDEADRMLDMGFIHDVRRVVKAVPKQRQTLLFSATMPPDIVDLSKTMLVSPVKVSVTPEVTTAEKVVQSVYFVSKENKRALLVKLLDDERATRTIVFTRTKHGANRLAEQLEREGFDAAAIHGNKSQGARERALEGFRAGTISVLVATDLAARGIDVDGISHVVNYELPNVPEQYVHRIGRTARAGASGRAIAFCAEDERSLLADIERVARQKIPVAGRIGNVPTLAVPQAGQRPQTDRPQGDGDRRQQQPRPQQHAGQRPRHPRPQGPRPQAHDGARPAMNARPANGNVTSTSTAQTSASPSDGPKNRRRRPRRR